MAEEQEETEEVERSPIDQMELIRSYGAFALRAVRLRRLLTGLTFTIVFGMTLIGLWLWPRTYHCESTILLQGTGALVATDEKGALRGASDNVRRRENLLRIIKETELAKNWISDRTPAQRLKEWVLRRPPPRPEDLDGPLLWALGSSLWVQQQGDTLTFGVDWRNPNMAAALVAAAQKVFLEARHAAEISTIQEKISIMDGHAVKVRKEMDDIAEQIKGVRDEKIAAATKPKTPAPDPAAGTPAPAPRKIKITTSVPAPVSDVDVAARKEELDLLRAELEAKKNALKDIKGQRSAALVTAQAQRNELLTKFTPAHPEVVQLDRKIEQLEDQSARTAPLEADIATLTTKIKALEAPGQGPTTVVTRVRTVGGGPAPSEGSAQKAEAIPAEILQLLETNNEADPAITVQLQGAISKYASLRDGIRSAQLDLDTAQAAFNHRYKIIEPPEPPAEPTKPKVPMVVGIGFFGAALLALALAMLLELRKGRIVERWQVYQMKLPILADLRLPSGSRD
jgi:uncharacterized protein involved in exopolysaccharide biosynthesis